MRCSASDTTTSPTTTRRTCRRTATATPWSPRRSVSGRLAIAVSNLFNSQAFDYGLIAQGVPLAQNAQAGGTPVVTERFGLPFRQIDFTYTLTAR